MNANLDSMRWVILQLLVIAAGVAFIVHVALHLPDIKWCGGFLVSIGTLNLLFYKSIGRRFFALTQSGLRGAARFWARGGERGTQLLVLGIGIILALAGYILLAVGTMWKK